MSLAVKLFYNSFLALAEHIPPTQPTISITLSSSTATVTIASDDNVTNYLVYKKLSDTSWTDGGNRAGPGTIEVSDLDSGVTYIFTVYSDNGILSVPDTVILTTPTETDSEDSSGQYHSIRASVFPLHLAHKGEDVIYYPAGGSMRPIRALVNRDMSTQNVKLTLEVANDPETGISSTEIDTGGDEIELSVRTGEAVQRRAISNMPHDCPSSLVVELS